MSDYSMPERRKTKTDKRAKARYNQYKKGGGKTVRSQGKKYEYNEN